MDEANLLPKTFNYASSNKQKIVQSSGHLSRLEFHPTTRRFAARSSTEGNPAA